MAKHITTRLSVQEVKEIIGKVPAVVSGTERDPYGLHNKFWAAVAFSMFDSISKSFEQKAQGQQDELGNKWEDITPETKAYNRPVGPRDLSRGQKRNLNSTTLGMLTPAQHKKWKQIFGSIYYSEKDKIGEDEAKKLAAQIAWTRLKREGADTKIRVLGDRNLLIMRDTDRLFRSFLPGKVTKNTYRKYNRDQVYIVREGEIEIGTKVEYAEQVFEDRPLWTGDMTPWIKKASHAGTIAILDYLKDRLQ